MALLRHSNAALARSLASHTVEQVGERVARLFRPARLRDAMRSVSLSWKRRGGSATQLSESEFLERLKRIIEQNAGSAQAGRINIVGLDGLKEKLGERWDEVRDRVQSVARSAMHKCLQPDDIWVPSGDRFVIAFGSLGFEEARTKCRMIARMIEMALLGDASTDTISVATATTTVDGKVVFRDLPSLETMIAGAGCFIQARPRFREPAAAKHGAAGSVLAMSRPRVPEALEAVIDDGEAPALARVVWEPVWDTRLQRITMYRARHVDKAARDHEAHLGEDDIGQIDFAARDAVIQELDACVVRSRVVALGLPVRFSTMASWARRRDYIATLREKISPELIKLFVIYLSEVPDGVPPTRLVELITALRPFCRELIVEGPLHMADFAALASARVFGIAADLHKTKMPEPTLLLKLEQFAHNATKSGIANCYLAGAGSMTIVTGAVGAGFRYISGAGIGAAVVGVSSSHPLSLEELYRNNLRAAS